MLQIRACGRGVVAHRAIGRPVVGVAVVQAGPVRARRPGRPEEEVGNVLALLGRGHGVLEETVVRVALGELPVPISSASVPRHRPGPASTPAHPFCGLVAIGAASPATTRDIDVPAGRRWQLAVGVCDRLCRRPETASPAHPCSAVCRPQKSMPRNVPCPQTLPWSIRP